MSASASHQLDELLREHFREAEPKAWPPAPQVVSSPVSAKSGMTSARWVLAVSIVAVVIVAKMLSSHFVSQTPTTGATLEAGSAKTPKEMRPNAGKSP